jgi:acetoin utilization deacetylase AcuC-like enzyme
MINPEAVTGRVFGNHNCPGHPESQERLETAVRGIPPPPYVRIREPVPAGIDDLLRVHDEKYLQMLEERTLACQPGRCCYLDPDTYVNSFSYETAFLAAGATMTAVDRALAGVHCFALVRPPGHHAGRNYAKGFCIINNAAVAASYALLHCDRVAIVDWDVHHGNGTQDIFYDSDRVFYCSVHQSPHFPGTGWPHETGIKAGEGYNLNIPLPAGSGIREYRVAFEKKLLPGINRFSPDILIISAGQDPLSDDPLGGMNLKPEDFGEMTGMIRDCFSSALALVLEGGYGPSHGEAVTWIFQALIADEVPE